MAKKKPAKGSVPKTTPALEGEKTVSTCGCEANDKTIFSPRATSISSLSASNAAVCTPTSFNTPYSPQGCHKTKNANGTYHVYYPFSMKADFSSVAPAQCSLCEYRQNVKGYFRYKENATAPWITVPQVLYGGVMLSATTYNEDGCNGGKYRYGHRSEIGCDNDTYSPARLTGCQYSADDAPGLNNIPAGYIYDFSLDFQGEIVDTSVTPPKVVLTNTWSTPCSGTA